MPADDSSNGFDNIADVLACRLRCSNATSPPRAKISRLAVGDPRDRAAGHHLHRQRRSQSEPARSTVSRPARAAAPSIRHNFPLDGEYLIKLSLAKLSFGQVFGEGAEGEELEVTLNGQRVKLFKLDEVPMFFMRESPGSHPPKPPPTDPLEERVKMTPEHPARVPAEREGGSADHRRRFLQKSYAADRGPGAPAAVEHLRT